MALRISGENCTKYFFDGITFEQFNIWNRNSWPPGAYQVPISGDPATIHGQQIEIRVVVNGEEVVLNDCDWITSCPHAVLKIERKDEIVVRVLEK